MTDPAAVSFRRRGLWAIADSAFSSTSNLAIVVYASHRLDPAAFGNVAICLAAATIVTVSVRSLTGEVRLLRREPRISVVPEGRHNIVAAANALLLSVIFGLAILGAGVLVHGQLGWSLIALGFICPAVCLQECIRYLAFADRRPERAALYDLIWLVAVVVMFASSPAFSRSETALLLTWGTGAALSCTPAIVLLARAEQRVASVPISLRHMRAGFPMLLEFWLASGVGHLGFILLAFFTSALEIASVKAVLTVYGPVNILYAAACASAVPDPRAIVRERRRFTLLFLLIGIGLATTTALLCICVLIFPELGRVLFSDAWNEARDLVVVAGVSQIAGSFSGGAVVGLRASGRVQSTATIRAALAPLALVVPLAGASYGGGRGYLVGLAVAGTIGAIIWWRALLRNR